MQRSGVARGRLGRRVAARLLGRTAIPAVVPAVTGVVLVFLAGTAAAERSKPSPQVAAPTGSAGQTQLVTAGARIDFVIPPQDLNAALQAFADASGIEVLHDRGKLQDLHSQGVTGSLTMEEALSRLLGGTGVTWRFTAPATVVLERVSAAGGAIALDPITVQGTAGPPPTATIGTLPPEYAGNQVARGGQVGALGNRDMMDSPFNAASFTAETIRNQQAETIADVLANDPAVRTSYGFGNFSEQFVIRGFPLFADDIAINGLYGVAPRQIVATEMYERVEVLRGASAFLNGAAPSGSGIGGGINLVPKRAGDEPLTRITGSFAQESRLGGHVDIGRRFGEDDAFGIRANGVYRGGETSIEDEDRSLVLGSLGFDWRGEQARASIDLGYQRQRIDEGRPVLFVTGPDLPDAPSADENYAQGWSYSKLRDTFALVRGEYDLAPTVTAHAAFGVRDMREDGDYATPTVDGTGAGTVGRLTVPREDTALSGQTGLRADLATGPVLHRLDAGVSALRHVNRNAFEFGANGPTDIYDPVDLPRPGPTLAAGDFDDLPKVSQTDLRSLYVADTLSVLDDRVLLTLGFRQQWLHIRGYDRTTGDRNANYDEDALTPMVGIVVRPTPEISLYANRIEGLAQGPTAPASAINAGEIFPPFRSTQYEVGGKLDLGSFGASLALFQTTQPTGITDPATLEFDVSGDQRNRGIELFLFGEPIEGLRVLGGATLIDAVLEETAGGENDGNDAVGVPDYQLNAGVDWDLPFLSGATVSGRVLHTASQYLDEANTQEISSWTRLDIGARYETEIEARKVVFRASVENVTNEAYWASASGGYLKQGVPLTAKLSVSVDF